MSNTSGAKTLRHTFSSILINLSSMGTKQVSTSAISNIVLPWSEVTHQHAIQVTMKMVRSMASLRSCCGVSSSSVLIACTRNQSQAKSGWPSGPRSLFLFGTEACWYSASLSFQCITAAFMWRAMHFTLGHACRSASCGSSCFTIHAKC